MPLSSYLEAKVVAAFRSEVAAAVATGATVTLDVTHAQSILDAIDYLSAGAGARNAVTSYGATLEKLAEVD